MENTDFLFRTLDASSARRRPPAMAVGAPIWLVLSSAAASTDGPGSERCRSLGFGPSLLCTSCTKLAEHVGKDSTLVEECAGCCTDEAQRASHFAKAVLDVCK